MHDIYASGASNPCEHFAARGRDYILSRATNDADRSGYPDDSIGDDDCAAYEAAVTAWEDRIVLRAIRGERPAPKRGRTKGSTPASEDTREPVLWLAGVRIDWHRALPELKVWAGQATLRTIVEGRQAALWEAGDPPGAILDWRIAYKTMSGLDPRVAGNALEIGFSPAKLGMEIMTYAAAELLAIVGMQVTPITRFGPRDYGYQDAAGNWWRFRTESREQHHYRLTMATRHA